jgi:hypothetical protein
LLFQFGGYSAISKGERITNKALLERISHALAALLEDGDIQLRTVTEHAGKLLEFCFSVHLLDPDFCFCEHLYACVCSIHIIAHEILPCQSQGSH